MTTILYSAILGPSPDLLCVSKWTEELELVETYVVGPSTCTCPAGERPTCKHRSDIRPLFLLRKHVGDGWFLDWSTRMWRHPTGDVAKAIQDAINDQAASSNGKTPPFDGGDIGSNPVAAATLELSPQPPSSTSEAVVAPPPSLSAPLGGGEVIKRRRIT